MKNLTLRHYAYFLMMAIILMMICGLTGCKSTKDLQKQTINENDDTKIKTAFTQTITECYEDSVKRPGVTVEGSKDIKDLAAGDSINEEKDGLEITTKLVNGKVKTTAVKKPEVIPVKGIKTTVNSLNQETEEKKHVEVKTKDLHKVTESNFNLNWLWLIIAGVVAFFLWYIFGFKRRKSG